MPSKCRSNPSNADFPLSICSMMWQCCCVYPVVPCEIFLANTHSWTQLLHIMFGHACCYWIVACHIDQDAFPVAIFQMDKTLWALVTAAGNEGHTGLWQQNEQGEIQSRHKKWKTEFEIMLLNMLELPCRGLLLQNLWNQQTDFSQYVEGRNRNCTAQGWWTFLRARVQIFYKFWRNLFTCPWGFWRTK